MFEGDSNLVSNDLGNKTIPQKLRILVYMVLIFNFRSLECSAIKCNLAVELLIWALHLCSFMSCMRLKARKLFLEDEQVTCKYVCIKILTLELAIFSCTGTEFVA